MSDTHKTKPFWVKLKQGHLDTREHHDHKDGPCDLPEQVELHEWQRKTHCRHEFHFTGTHVCCCSMCHSDWGNNEKRRRKRDEFRQTRQWKDEWESPIVVGSMDAEELHDWAVAEDDCEAAAIAHDYCPACYLPAHGRRPPRA